MIGYILADPSYVMTLGGHEGGVLQRHDRGVGDDALLQLVLLGMGADAQRHPHRRPIGEDRADRRGVAHIGGVGAGLADHIVGQDRRPHGDLGFHRRGRGRSRRRLLLLAEGEGGGRAGRRQRQEQRGSHYSKA